MVPGNRMLWRGHVFGGVAVALPDRWNDITGTLPEPRPWTLAHEDGWGALQFTIALYRSGALPDLGVDALRRLLQEFTARQSMSAPLESGQRVSPVPMVWSDHHWSGAFVRVWYVSNGRDIAAITFVVEPGGPDRSHEVEDAQAIVESMLFLRTAGPACLWPLLRQVEEGAELSTLLASAPPPVIAAAALEYHQACADLADAVQHPPYSADASEDICSDVASYLVRKGPVVYEAVLSGTFQLPARETWDSLERYTLVGEFNDACEQRLGMSSFDLAD